ncbi:flagellar motor stator protein MotA [Mixta theicola]|uniref:Flagellar motor stator protein MotA n=1 Tax=Mixta theicola TaxID=1458355 RepID=A0A2K1Q5C4_9GAMM|nr:flagellar motor stator protein MotA [Mixta theicola]PNS10248.1 flagellar motor stator protein MotA [Mixta theicola]GLR11056.1 flagellar motor protein MotA [Mixta theicola]
MLVILGYILVVGSVLGGYMMVGGHLGALYQPSELIIIGGAGIGAFVVGNNGKAIKATLKALPLLFRGSKYNKALYMDLMALLYRLMAKSRQQGMMSLERDIENPKESEIFANYPRILSDNKLVDFITDYMRLMISGNMNAFEIEALMDEEIETYEHECDVPAQSISAIGDSLPAFGIVAAVMGVVHALASADRPAAELGELIAHAMVGTFLGILLAYGFISPLSAVLRQKCAETTKMMQCIKVTLLSSLNGYAPQIAVEFGRKTLYSTERPSFTELEEHVRNAKSAGKQTSGQDA